MRDNINERRAYIADVIDRGEDINIKQIIKDWNSSYPAIQNDISVILAGKQAYVKPQTTTQNVRAKKINVDGILAESDWQKILEKYNHACAICGSGEKLAIDHIVPLSRGGTNTIDNTQPLCKSCNSRKGNATETQKASRWGHNK